MNISISDGVKNVCIDDSGITVTWKMFIPWMKPCPILDALEVMQRGKIVCTPKIDENNTLALVEDSSGCGYVVMFSNQDGVTETRYTFMGRQVFGFFFDAVDNTPKPRSKELQALVDAFAEEEQK